MDEDQLTLLRGHCVALEQVFTSVLINLSGTDSGAKAVVLHAFDRAANSVEHISIGYGERARHFTAALKFIEEMRRAVEDSDQ